MTMWCYSPDLSFEENCKSGAKAPLLLSTENKSFKPRLFLGKILATPFGVAASPATTADGIQVLSKLGYSYFTYPTIKSHKQLQNSKPNLIYINSMPLMHADLIDEVIDVEVSSHPTATMSHIVDGATMPLGWYADDIERAKSYLNANQCLTVSICGEGSTLQFAERDWLNLVVFSKESGADCIELNLSGANSGKYDKLFYFDDAAFIKVVKMICQVAGDVPVVAKIPYLHDMNFIEKRIQQLCHCGVQGITALQALQVRLTNQREPLFGETQQVSMLSGEVIYNVARDYILRILEIKRRHELDFMMIACGGIHTPYRMQAILDAGADLVTSAATVMRDPFWALKYFKEFEHVKREEAALDQSIA